MNETMYIFKLDAQARITIPAEARKIFDFEDIVYMKLHIVDEVKYIQIAAFEIEFYHCSAKIDKKGRFFVPKEVKEKFNLKKGDVLISFEEEKDVTKRSLFLRLST